MRKFRKIISIMGSIIFSLSLLPAIAFAAGGSITVDGNFGDWSGVTKCNAGSSSILQNAAMVWSGDRVYVYISEKSGKSCAVTWGKQFSIQGEDGDALNLNFQIASGGYGSNDVELNVINTTNWKSMDVKAMGEKMADGSYQYECSFPASLFSKSSKVTFKDENGNVLVSNVSKGAVPTPAPTATPKPTSTPTATQKPGVSGGPIVVDGYYDDWTGFDQDDAFTWMSNNSQCSHVGGIYMDDKNVFVHVKLHKYYITHVPVDNYALTVNGKTVGCFAQFKNADNTIHYGDVYNLPVGIKTNLGIFSLQGSHEFLGDMAVTIADKQIHYENGQPYYDKTDEFEFSISKETLSKLTGIPVESIKTVSFGCTNLGGGVITTSGTSTGPFIGVTICLLVVGSVWVFAKKRKRVKA